MKPSMRLWSTILTLALIAIPTAICGGLLYFYVRDELDNRRMISFMNFEQLGHRFDRSLDKIAEFTDDEGTLRFNYVPLALVGTQDRISKTVAGKVPDGFNLADLPNAHCDVQNISNINYILCPVVLPKSSFLATPIEAGYYWSIWRLPSQFLEMFGNIKPSRVFMVNSHGKLIYQSDSHQPQKDLLHKPFVQEYIRLPLSKEATAPYTELENQVIGFAMNLEHTNVTFFVESPASIVFAALWKPTTWVLCALIFGVIFLALLGRFVIATIKEQVDGLAESFDNFTQGHQIPLQHNPENFLRDFEPLVASLNANTLQLREMLDAGARRPVVPDSLPETEETPATEASPETP